MAQWCIFFMEGCAMLKRAISPVVARYAASWPAVTILGPRQAGKTTLAKALFPTYSYANLEAREARELAAHDMHAFFSLYPPPVIIDEVQTVPDILSQIQVRIDENRKACGQFILTGSHQSALSSAIAKSLAGRTAIVDMLPLSFAELSSKDRKLPTDELMIRGFMPEIVAEGKAPDEFYRFYYRTYIERDISDFVNLRNKSRFEKFMVLLAGRTGQLLNLSSLAAEVGISSTTLEGWLSLLEASYVCFRLRPYFANIGKRMVKTPKLYFYETGLVCHLLGIKTPEQLMHDPLRGNVFENMVVSERIKQLCHCGQKPELYFLRTAKGFEIDLLEKDDAGKFAVSEIKSAMSWHRSLIENLETYLAQWPGESRATLVYDGKKMTTGSGISCLNFRHWHATAPDEPARSASPA